MSSDFGEFHPFLANVFTFLMQANCAEQMFHPRKKDSSGF
jgi:hypothetical protein